ncbi:MAG: Gfo/Idh/MocA family oxidoreductase [Chloroflexota bacterium]
MRVGVIGAGAWAVTTHLPVIVADPDVELVVVNRRDGATARAIADRFGAAHATDDWQAAIGLGLDAVVVASPPNVHRAQVEAALASGAHVLCEKPFAIAATDAWAMADAARAAGRHLLVAFGWNYMPLMTSARDVMRERGIGRIEYVNIAINVAVRELLLNGTPYNSAVGGVAPKAETFVVPEISGGGTAPVTMSHVFGLGLFLTGLDARDMFCRTVDAHPGVDLHDVMSVGFANGAIGSFTGTASHESVPRVEWHVSIHGTGGQLLLDSNHDEVAFGPSTGELVRPLLPAGAGVYDPRGPIRELLSVAKGGAPTDASPAEMGARTVELVEAALRSAASGRVEPVPAGRPAWARNGEA